jgi:hypothetical protein
MLPIGELRQLAKNVVVDGEDHNYEYEVPDY